MCFRDAGTSQIPAICWDFGVRAARLSPCRLLAHPLPLYFPTHWRGLNCTVLRTKGKCMWDSLHAAVPGMNPISFCIAFMENAGRGPGKPVLQWKLPSLKKSKVLKRRLRIIRCGGGWDGISCKQAHRCRCGYMHVGAGTWCWCGEQTDVCISFLLAGWRKAQETPPRQHVIFKP